ncbi:hypothetical protein [Burkholderia sp. Ac-20353]|uniref:hypothetical protein n=1 Tax=Burkholderia sp. Ac-20353 TaxID=2703894 RepID=UPI00197B318C|nr:hypothetical protein [Burkholderia sp. Ac-20353]MBN3791366.1 hypothetical protein [Burkholderia sp. Ac-20353]
MKQQYDTYDASGTDIPPSAHFDAPRSCRCTRRRHVDRDVRRAGPAIDRSSPVGSHARGIVAHP